MYEIKATIHKFEYDDNKENVFEFMLPFQPTLHQTVDIEGEYVTFKSKPVWRGKINGEGFFTVDAYKFTPVPPLPRKENSL